MSWLNHQAQFRSGAPSVGPLRRESASSDGICTDLSLADAALAAVAPQLVPPPQADQLHFTVRYTLPEYVSFMWQHVGYIIRRRRIGRLATWWMLTKSTFSAAFNFVTQGRSRHLYDVTIDEYGIIRTSGTGVTLVPWADVSAIRRYSRGYMMVLKRGTLPIPFRCLSGPQAGIMDTFAASVKAAPRR